MKRRERKGRERRDVKRREGREEGNGVENG